MEESDKILKKLPDDALENPEDYPELEKALKPGESMKGSHEKEKKPAIPGTTGLIPRLNNKKIEAKLLEINNVEDSELFG